MNTQRRTCVQFSLPRGILCGVEFQDITLDPIEGQPRFLHAVTLHLVLLDILLSTYEW